jgi:GNAT superfamily N-acetyltransferase
MTNGATFAWLCDVMIDPAHRGAGLSVFLIETATRHPEERGLRFLLGTKNAHELDPQFGFATPVKPERLMEVRPGVPESSS